MAFGFTTYVDPGVYQQEVIVPSGINIPAQPFAVCLVGTGSRNKRVNNEPVLRGIVKHEVLSGFVADSGPPATHSVSLSKRADRRLDNTTLYRTLNGITSTVLDAYVSFDPAFILGTVTSAVDLSSLNAFALEEDGIARVTIVMHDLPSYATGTSTVFTPGSGSAGTIARSGATFAADGIRVGMTFTVSGGVASTGANNGVYTVTGIPATGTLAVTKSSGVMVSETLSTFALAFAAQTAAIGREMHVLYDFSVGIAAAAISEIAAAVNAALSSTAGASLGFGASYANSASVSSSALKISSPSSAITSDVRVSSANSADALTAIFGASGASNRAAVSVLRVNDLVWNASATWAVDYVDLDSLQDALLQTSNITSVLAVGRGPGSTNFNANSDWKLDVPSDLLDWDVESAAVITSANGPTFDLSTGPNNILDLQIDGLHSGIDGSLVISIDLLGLAAGSRPLGYVVPSVPTAATAAEVANNINAVLAAALGPKYKSVASVVVVNGVNRVRLTSPKKGQSGSSLAVLAHASASAHTLIFGGEIPLSTGSGTFGNTMGTGKAPSPGSVYFVTYEYVRPVGDYEVPMRHFSVEAALAQVGRPAAQTAAYNPLGVAAQLCFENGAQFIYTVQVNDTSEGNPSRNQVLNALDGAASIVAATEIVVVGEPGTRLDVTTDILDLLETQNGPTEKHYCRGFFGMSVNTPIGDRNTVNSMVGRATRTLQVGPNSPARGRMFLLAPPQVQGVTKDLTLEDGQVARVSMDGTYIAVAMAAARTSNKLFGPADTLTRKTISGFNTDDILNPWRPAERRAMASQGVCVVTYDAGRFIFVEAMSTEGGGGGLAEFQVDSTSYQKDVVVKKVDQALDANIVGVVPFDLSSFVLDIKLVIQGVLAGEVGAGTIGPYRDKASGAIRTIDARTDIRVSQSPNVPTEFDFSYWFNLRYPALRLLGQYSVDNPFFALAA